MLTHICMALVGGVFTVTGVMKAVNARPFVRQVDEYRLLNAAHLLYAALMFISLELVLGAGLLLRASDWLLPAGIAVLIGLTTITIWGTATGRVEECGCYGGLLLLTPASERRAERRLHRRCWPWAGPPPAGNCTAAPVAPWKVGAVALAGIAGAAAGMRSMRRGPLFEYKPLKIGKAWNPRWLTLEPGATPDGLTATHGSCLAVFLSKDCPYCKQWVPFLNIIHVQPDLPPRARADVARQRGARPSSPPTTRFTSPSRTSHAALAGLLVTGYPTAVLIEGGVIRQTWFGEMPQAYVDRIKGFYQSITVGPERRPRGFSG